MPVQRSEDAGRNLRNVWLGPTNGWRWWFDATFDEWAVGILFWIAAALALTFALPLGALLVIVALAGGRWVATSQSEETWARLLRAKEGKGRQRIRRSFTTLLVVFGLLWFPQPLTWLLPMHWWLAGPAAVYCAVRFVKRVRPWIDANRPVTYWISALKDITHGPRPAQRDLVQNLALSAGPSYSEINRDLLDFEIAVMAFDLEGMTILQYREKMPPVEAALFDSTARDARMCEGIVAWLRSAGADVKILDVTRDTEGVMRRAVITVNGQPLVDNRVIVLDRTDGTFRQFKRTQFALQFEATSTIEEATNVQA